MTPAAPVDAGGQAGFSLLEGLVAIAILAGTLVAIFALVGGVLSSANQVGRSNDVAEVVLNALETMSVVNPMERESGQIDLGSYKISWSSTAITPVTDGTGYPAGISNYRVALYESEVQVEEPAGSTLTRFKLRQVGYRRVRESVSPLPAGAMAPGVSGAMGPGVSGAMAPGVSGAMGPGVSGTMAPGASGAMAPGVGGAMGPGVSGTMAPGVSGTMAPGTSGAITPGVSGAMAPGASGVR